MKIWLKKLRKTKTEEKTEQAKKELDQQNG